MSAAVRISPLASADWQEKPAVTLTGNTITAANDRNHFQGEYGVIFTDTSSYMDVFAFTEQTVTAASRGYNSALFIYGQASSDKSSLLLGDSQGRPGLAQLTLSKLLPQLASDKKHRYRFFFSCLLIYSEKIFDLLRTEDVETPLTLREFADGSTSIPGLSLHKVSGAEDCVRLMKNAKECLGASDWILNACTVVYRCAVIAEKAGRRGNFRTLNFDLCDMATTEKPVGKGTGAVMMRLSISQLGKVVYALAHVGKATASLYRGSKFTRLLQQTIVQGVVCFLVVISPAKADIEETITSLKFAEAAQKVLSQRKRLKRAAADLKFVKLLQGEVNLLRDFCSSCNIGLEGDDTFVAIGRSLSVSEVERLLALRSLLYEKLVQTHNEVPFAEFVRERDSLSSRRTEGACTSVTTSQSRISSAAEQRNLSATTANSLLMRPDEMISALQNELLFESVRPGMDVFECASTKQITLRTSSPSRKDSFRQRNNSSVPGTLRENDDVLPVRSATPVKVPPRCEPYLTFDQSLVERRVQRDLGREEVLRVKKQAVETFRQRKVQDAEDSSLLQSRFEEEMRNLENEKKIRKQQLDEKLEKDEQDLISLRRKMQQKPRIEPKGLKPKNRISRLKEMLVE